MCFTCSYIAASDQRQTSPGTEEISEHDPGLKLQTKRNDTTMSTLLHYKKNRNVPETTSFPKLPAFTLHMSRAIIKWIESLMYDPFSIRHCSAFAA
jgi:hypothetical protein